MLSLQKKSRSKGGQAVVEFIPALFLFFCILTAMYEFYRVMREATIRQEVVRNLAFAKIGNMGTLTSVKSQNIIGNDLGLLLGNDNPSVGYTNQCIAVVPLESPDSGQVDRIVGAAALAPIGITTYAVILRAPAQCP